MFPRAARSKRSRGVLGALRRCDAGNVAIVFALALPLILGCLGYGVEITYWVMMRTTLQRQADAAAFAAAIEARSGGTPDSVKTVAKQSANEHGFDRSSDIEVHTYAAPPPGEGNLVEVVVRQDLDRVFTSVFMAGKVHLAARSIASFAGPRAEVTMVLRPENDARERPDRGS